MLQGLRTRTAGGSCSQHGPVSREAELHQAEKWLEMSPRGGSVWSLQTTSHPASFRRVPETRPFLERGWKRMGTEGGWAAGLLVGAARMTDLREGLSEAGRKGPLTVPGACLPPPRTSFRGSGRLPACLIYQTQCRRPARAHPPSGCQVGSTLSASAGPRSPSVLQDRDCDQLLMRAVGVPHLYNSVVCPCYLDPYVPCCGLSNTSVSSYI